LSIVAIIIVYFHSFIKKKEHSFYLSSDQLVLCQQPQTARAIILKMLHNTIRALPVLLLATSAIATPLEQREAAPGLIEDLLTGILNPIQQLIKDIISGVKSGITDEISSKPLVCLQALDSCCVCKYHPIDVH
jgi:hypothetical protein